MRSLLTALAATAFALAACTDAPTTAIPHSRAGPALDEVSSANEASHSLSTVRWNRTAIALFRARGGGAGRINAYLSLAQYRAILTAQDARHGTARPSLAAAAAGASVVVLEQFYPLDVVAIEGDLEIQRGEATSGRERNTDFDDGEVIGRAVGAAVLSLAATDNNGLTSPGVPPVGAGYWTSSGAPIVRGGFGARPFFLRSGSELRLPPPPAFGSPAFVAALAEVRALSDNRTADQVAIAQKWVPFSGVVFNGIATDLIVKYHRSELEAARTLAYANAAAVDAIIACFDTKFTYWFIRPTQADPAIKLAVGLPNHPSYPSGHSCETGAWQGVLDDAFPNERAMLAETAQEASMSRVYGGLHYRFDGEGGLSIGRSAARLALERRGLEP
jgi:hypothetical protein